MGNLETPNKNGRRAGRSNLFDNCYYVYSIVPRCNSILHRILAELGTFTFNPNPFSCQVVRPQGVFSVLKRKQASGEMKDIFIHQLLSMREQSKDFIRCFGANLGSVCSQTSLRRTLSHRLISILSLQLKTFTQMTVELDARAKYVYFLLNTSLTPANLPHYSKSVRIPPHTL